MAQQMKALVYSNFVCDEIFLEGNLLRHRMCLHLLSIAMINTTIEHKQLGEEKANITLTVYSL